MTFTAHKFRPRILENATEKSFSLCLSALIDAADFRFDSFLDLMRRSAAEARDSSSLRFRFFLRHVLFLVESGDELYTYCGLRLHQGSRPILVAHRVAKESETGIVRTTLKFASWPMTDISSSLTVGAFAVHSGGVEVIVHRGPVVVDQAVQGAGITAKFDPLRDNEFEAFYENRRVLQSIMRPDREETTWRIAQKIEAAADERAVALASVDAFEFDSDGSGKIRGGRAVRGICRKTHPFIGAALHILPRLIEPAESKSILQCLSSELPCVSKAGFEAILLGVVDPQSSELFHTEDDGGLVRPYINNHGYWSSGEYGIDPAIGTEDDYVALAKAASACGITMIQDSVFGTLGYPPQLPRLRSPGSKCTPTTMFLGDRHASLSDKGVFLRDLESCNAIPSVSDACCQREYISLACRTHFSDYYELPRPNLFDSQVLKSVLQRVRWQVRKAGISAFRIDMAKHIGVNPLREIITTLKQEVSEYGGTDLSVLMEYWSVNYRDLRFALACTAPINDGLYLYDYPLAYALQQILLKDADWSEILPKVADQRRTWHVPVYCLVPIFIDHDPNFRPIYNGSTFTRDIVLTGLTMALAMSANGPSVYHAYDDRLSAPSNFGAYFDYTEQHARRPVSSPLTRDPEGPGAAFRELLAEITRFGVLSDWDANALVFEGDRNSLRISRTLKSDAIPRKATFCMSRGDDAFSKGVHGERLVFASGSGPSIALFVNESA